MLEPVTVLHSSLTLEVVPFESLTKPLTYLNISSSFSDIERLK